MKIINLRLKILTINIYIFILIGLSLTITHCIEVPAATETLETSIMPPGDTIYGFSNNEYWFEKRIIKPNQFMANFLSDFGVEYKKVLELEELSDSTLSLRKIKAGKEMVCIKESECENPRVFVYQPDDFHYVLYSLGDSVYSDIVEIPHYTCLETASGIVTTTLWDAMVAKNMSIQLIDKMEDALAAFDFTMAQINDEFKLIYDQIYIDDKPVSVGQLHAAYYRTGKDEFIGIYFENEKYQGFYDEKGRPTKRAFLKAPIRASYRISSVYNLRRFHPVDRRVKAHRGTDYAAAYGTPIRAVADGKVVIAGYTGGNGKYVKIRHDKVYQTQYLHMKGYAQGIRSGKYVKQGQIIGYVGSTGKATGPHVCFRFWKNGRQIDHRRENFPPLDPMTKDQLPEYLAKFDLLSEFLDKIDISEDVVES